MNDESSFERTTGEALSDDELALVVGGDEEHIKGDININPNRN